MNHLVGRLSGICGFLAFGCRQGATSFIGHITAWLRRRLTDDTVAGTIFDEPSASSISPDPRCTQVEGSVGHRRGAPTIASDPVWRARQPEGAVR